LSEPKDKRTREDLYADILLTHWTPVTRKSSSYGVNITFVKNATSLYPGATTKEVFGKTDEDAYHKFLSELAESPE
jgi:hypothetical protein